METCEVISAGLALVTGLLTISLHYANKKLHRADERVEELTRTLESVNRHYNLLPLVRKEDS